MKQITDGMVRRAREESVSQRECGSGLEGTRNVSLDLGYGVDEKTGDVRIVQY